MSNYRGKLDKIVDNVGYTIVRLAPIVAPIPALATLLEATGYAVYAWFVVVAVELTGYAIGEEAVKAVRLRVFSIKNIAWVLAIYALIIEGLMIGYKVLPAWVEWHTGAGDLSHAIQATVGILYPAFTIAGAFLFALHEYLGEVQGDMEYDKETIRERDRATWEDDREWKRTEREARLAARAVKLSVKSTGESGVKSSGRGEDFTPDFTPAKAGDRRVILRDILASEFDGKTTEELNKSALARRLSVTRPTINADLESLIATGELSLNGHVVVKK